MDATVPALTPAENVEKHCTRPGCGRRLRSNNTKGVCANLRICGTTGAADEVDDEVEPEQSASQLDKRTAGELVALVKACRDSTRATFMAAGDAAAAEAERADDEAFCAVITRIYSLMRPA